MIVVNELTLSNYRDFCRPGKKLAYERGFAIIKEDKIYEDGMKADGMSIRVLLEKHGVNGIYIFGEI